MKKLWTMLICLALTAALAVPAFAAEATAEKSFQKVILDGTEVSINSYLINGTNYFKLRDVAAIMNGTCTQFNVTYNKSAARIELASKTGYAKQSGDLTALQDGKVSAKVTKQSLVVDDKTYQVETALIGQNNFVKLRDLGKILGFSVEFDKSTKAIVIKTSSQKGVCDH